MIKCCVQDGCGGGGNSAGSSAYIIASLTLIKLGLNSGPFEDFGPNLN